MGAGQEVGRSCFLLETDVRILFDYGIKIFSKEGGKRQHYPMPFQGQIDGAIISHAHLDHSGFVPHLYTRQELPWYGTPPTFDIASVLWRDSLKIMGKELPYRPSHMKKAQKGWVPMLNGKGLHLGETKFTMWDAGHILGASSILAEYKGAKIVYSGDFKDTDTQMHIGSAAPEDVDVLILETTYSNRDHPDRSGLERELGLKIEATLMEGGCVLMPAFAVGRSQELLMTLRSLLGNEVPIYLDGMSREVTRIYLKYPDYVKNYGKFEEVVESVTLVGHPGDRREAVSTPSVIVSTAGMMEGGPALGYLLNLPPHSRMIFTGYNVEGTNGWRILNEGKVRIDENILDVEVPSEYMDFSAHVGRKGLFDYVDKANPQKLVLNHGDSCPEFAEELRSKGYEVYAPKNGELMEFEL